MSDAVEVTVGENGGASTGGETVAAPVARVVTEDLGGKAWKANRTTGLISINVCCSPAEREYYIWRAAAALLEPRPGPPRLRVVR